MNFRPACISVSRARFSASVVTAGRCCPLRCAKNRIELASGSVLSLIAICLLGMSGCGGGAKTPTAISIGGSGTSGSGSSAASATLTPGATTRLEITATEPDGTTVDVTAQAAFTTSNPKVATVDSNGIVTAVAPGTAVITAQYKALIATLNVTV